MHIAARHSRKEHPPCTLVWKVPLGTTPEMVLPLGCLSMPAYAYSATHASIMLKTLSVMAASTTCEHQTRKGLL